MPSYDEINDNITRRSREVRELITQTQLRHEAWLHGWIQRLAADPHKPGIDAERREMLEAEKVIAKNRKSITINFPGLTFPPPVYSVDSPPPVRASVFDGITLDPADELARVSMAYNTPEGRRDPELRARMRSLMAKRAAE